MLVADEGRSLPLGGNGPHRRRHGIHTPIPQFMAPKELVERVIISGSRRSPACPQGGCEFNREVLALPLDKLRDTDID